jgi:hypothetical protein
MDYMNNITEKIMEAKNKEEVLNLLCDVYFATQYDSTIRKEFDKWAEYRLNKNRGNRNVK